MSKQKPPEMTVERILFSQEGDCWSSEDQDLVVLRQNGGDGDYWVIETQRWAFDGIDEVVNMLRRAGVPEKGTDPVPQFVVKSGTDEN